MSSVQKSEVMGRRILKELKKNKILLLQDKVFPNIVSLITKSEVKGSWWSHPLANPIYNGLNWLTENQHALVVKLLSGKVTYISADLWSDFYSIVEKKNDWQLQGLSKADRSLLKKIESNDELRSDTPMLKSKIDFKRPLQNLEKRILIFSKEEHTQSGKHIRIFKSWSKVQKTVKTVDPKIAMQKFESIVGKMNNRSGARMRLPWQDCS